MTSLKMNVININKVQNVVGLAVNDTWMHARGFQVHGFVRNYSADSFPLAVRPGETT